MGCIPKKLMHNAGLLGEGFSDARGYGWKLPEKIEMNWEDLVMGVQNHIGSLNWGYRVALREASVKVRGGGRRGVYGKKEKGRWWRGAFTRIEVRRGVMVWDRAIAAGRRQGSGSGVWPVDASCQDGGVAACWQATCSRAAQGSAGLPVASG